MPKIGLRMVKSALAVFVCLFIGYFRSGGLPFYSAIAAVLCMQKDLPNSVRVAVNRVIGTIFGGLYGIAVLAFVKNVLPNVHALVYYLLIAASLIPLMYITILAKQKNATYITCVVFLSIVISHEMDAVPYMFAVNRVLDTLIGIFVSLLINLVRPVRSKQNPPEETDCEQNATDFPEQPQNETGKKTPGNPV